ncbi:MAG TPA: hypothetical protein VMV08_07575, partial [Gaiellaceae bacterium]|nr:hypothetical protein [Gaiellaceae bacterium]
MKTRLVLAAVVVSIVLPSGSSAASTPLTNYPVPRGGFTVALPSTWVALTSTTPVPGANGKTPSMAAIAKAANADGSKKLVALDPKAKGKVYLDVDVDRIGRVSATAAAAATANAIRKVIGATGSLTSTPVKLDAGPAFRLHVVYKQAGEAYESSEYLLVQGQIEYLILYVAPKASWPTYSAIFEASARSFRLLASPNLRSVVLSNAQVGSGYKGSVIPGGDSFIGEATLDLCAGTFPSESLRTGRLQMSYLHKGKAVPVSNEVVTYVSGGAQEALREVRAVAESCARTPVVVRRGTVTNTLTVVPIRGSNLLPGAVAVRITVLITAGKKRATSTGVAIYQVKNNMLSGVYAWSTADTTIAQAEQ